MQISTDAPLAVHRGGEPDDIVAPRNGSPQRFPPTVSIDTS